MSIRRFLLLMLLVLVVPAVAADEPEAGPESGTECEPSAVLEQLFPPVINYNDCLNGHINRAYRTATGQP